MILKFLVRVSVWFLKILFQFVIEFWFEFWNFSSDFGLVFVWKSVEIFRVQGEKFLYAWNKEKGFRILFENFFWKFTNKEEKSLKSFIGSWVKICELKVKSRSGKWRSYQKAKRKCNRELSWNFYLMIPVRPDLNEWIENRIQTSIGEKDEIWHEFGQIWESRYLS